MSEPNTSASQLLAEAAAALHAKEGAGGRPWTDLTDAEKVPYIARVIPVTFAVLMTTRPPGYVELTATILAVDVAIQQAYPEGSTP